MEDENKKLTDELAALRLAYDEHPLVPGHWTEYEAQRRSFAYGNVNLDNPAVTREVVDKAIEEEAIVPRVLIKPSESCDPCKGCDQEKPICCSECPIASLPEASCGATKDHGVEIEAIPTMRKDTPFSKVN